MHQQLPGFHVAIVLYVHGNHGSANSGADSVQVPIDLRIIRGFIRTEIHQQQHSQNHRDHETRRTNHHAFAMRLDVIAYAHL